MKKFLSSLLFVILCISVYAGPKDNAIEMVEFEQGWLDRESSISLRNNTTETIHNVTFLITYYDMKGRELDYKEFAEEIEIEPEKTKRLDIPAYEHDRDYHYYKSENRPGGSPAFKVKFELKDYNSSNFQTEEEKDIALYNQLIGKDDYGIPESSSSNFDIIFILLVSLFLVGSYIGTYFLVMSMARNRNRDTAVWLIIAIIGSPVLAIIILLMAGDSNSTDSF